MLSLPKKEKRKKEFLNFKHLTSGNMFFYKILLLFRLLDARDLAIMRILELKD